MSLELFPYQAAGVARIRAAWATCGAIVLADACGLGKTPQFLAAPDRDVGVLVQVPAALKSQTAERIIQWRGPNTRVEILEGVGSYRHPEPGEWLIVNAAILPAAPGEIRAAKRELKQSVKRTDGKLPMDLGAATTDEAEAALAVLERRGAAVGPPPRRMVYIVDEAHDISGKVRGSAAANEAIRTRSMCQETRAVDGNLILSTATPLRNDPSDFSRLLSTGGLLRHAWWKQDPDTGKVKTDSLGYAYDWGGKVIGGQAWGLRAPSTDRIVPKLRPVMLRRLFEDYAPQVPRPAKQIGIMVDLDEAARRLADDELSRIADLWRGNADELTGIEGLRAEGSRVGFEMTSRVRAALSMAKLPAALDWIDARNREGEPVVVGDTNLGTIKAIGRRPRTRIITGAESGQHRAETVRMFQRGDLDCVAMTFDAGGVGIDLYRACHFLAISRPWNPAVLIQFIARLVRLGQGRVVQPWYLLANHPLERRISELLRARWLYYAVIDACAERAA